MAKKNDKEVVDGEAVPSHIAEMMGPTPREAAAKATAGAPKPGAAVEPSSAPIIPDNKLPEEIIEAKAAAKTEPKPEAPPVEETDPVTDEAVEDIVRGESDELLKHEDKELEKAFAPAEKPAGFFGKIKHAVNSWWHNPKARNATLAGVGVLIVVALAVPVSRYAVLNTLGVRAGMSVVVVDEGTLQPLKNVSVKVGGQSAQTDTEGRATLKKLRLGSNSLEVEKVAFAPVSRKVTLGWGSNPLSDLTLTPTGAQYRFVVKDFMSDKPMPNAEASSGLASAVADEKGEIVLTVDVDEQESIDVSIKSADYRTETLKVPTSTKDSRNVKMAPARQHVFVSKRSGKFDVYKIYADGKQEKILLNATGTERDDMVIAPHPSKNVVAIVSTRDNEHNDDGFLLSGLMTIDVESGEKNQIATSERVQVVDWVGDRLVYVSIDSGQSADSPKRHRLMSYDVVNDESQELAYSNYFNDVMIAKGVIYYAPSSSGQSGKVALRRVNPDGTHAQAVLDKETWNLFRVSYDKLQFSVQQNWYDYVLGDVTPTKLEAAPADPKNRIYRDSPDGKRSLWVDQRDGKGVLLNYDLTAKKDKSLQSQSGLRNPVSWLGNNYVVYRIHTDQETADYVMNLDGGDPRKIKDVTNTGGIDRWYYYQ